MDGMHDLGGTQGFGAVVRRGDCASFHADWEVRVNAISGALVGAGIYNMDEYRHGIERMEPRHYVTASYFERVFTTAATLCIEKGLFSLAQLEERAGGPVPLARPSAPGREPAHGAGRFAVGQKVLVKNDFVPGHTRMPAYIRGKTGVVVGVSPEYPYPDAAGHGDLRFTEPTYDVCFAAQVLWPDGCEAADVHVGVFQSYLQPVDA
ncbi:MAG: SH3-like domain-containing protein [Ottowia sp.]|uniref:SH3-like domain-containing protein n=1 Tax=Ottowia sp. TaxID=1898956 RepID=UPI003C74A0D5